MSSPSSPSKPMPAPPRTTYPPLAVALSKAMAGLSRSPSSVSSSRSRSPSPFTTPSASPLSPPSSSSVFPAASPPPLTALPPIPGPFAALPTHAPSTSLPALPPLSPFERSHFDWPWSATAPNLGGVSPFERRSASPGRRAGSIPQDTDNPSSSMIGDSRGTTSSIETGSAEGLFAFSDFRLSSSRRVSVSTAGSGHSIPSPPIRKSASPLRFRRGSNSPKTPPVQGSPSAISDGSEGTLEERKDQYMKDKNGRRISPEILPQIELFERLTKKKEDKWMKKLEGRLSDDLFAGSPKASKSVKTKKAEKVKKVEEKFKKAEKAAKRAEDEARVVEHRVTSPQSPPPRPARDDDMGMDIVSEVQSFMVKTLPAVPPQRAPPLRPSPPPAPSIGLSPLTLAASMRRGSADASIVLAADLVSSHPQAADRGRPARAPQRRPALQAVSPNGRKHVQRVRPLLHALETALPLSARLSAIPEISPLGMELSPEGIIRSRQGSTTLQLRSGSVITISAPSEVDAWVRNLYLPGPIQTQPLGPTLTTALRKGSVASMDAFQDGVELLVEKSGESVTPRRSSDDAVVDEIIDFFGEFGYQMASQKNVDPTVSEMVLKVNRERKTDQRSCAVAKMREHLTLSINGDLAEMENRKSIQSTPLSMYMPSVA